MTSGEAVSLCAKKKETLSHLSLSQCPVLVMKTRRNFTSQYLKSLTKLSNINNAEIAILDSSKGLSPDEMLIVVSQLSLKGTLDLYC